MRLEIDVSNADIFRSYLERFTTGDADGAAALLADDFSFAGPVLQADTKAEFLAGAAALAPIVRGCVVHHQWVDGEQVASFYDFKVETPVGAGSIPMAEWSVVRDGKLVSSRLVFDTARMAALMPSS
jgi:ketosteroid isomerase-like protein